MENEESPYVVGQDASSISETPKVSFPEGSKKIKGGRWILIAIAAILVVAGGAIFIIGARKSNKVEFSASPTPEAMGETVEPTPEASIEPIAKDEVKIQILNGTGISGEASFLQGVLQKLGYSIIDVGNATSQDGAKKTTEVVFSSELDDSTKSEIQTKLEAEYQDVKVSSTTSTNVDIKITTGLRTGQTPKPEETATPKPTSSASPTASSSGTSQ